MMCRKSFWCEHAGVWLQTFRKHKNCAHWKVIILQGIQRSGYLKSTLSGVSVRGGDLLAQASRGLIIPHFSRTSAKFPVCLNATFAVALCTSSATLGENRTGAFSGPPHPPPKKEKNDRRRTHLGRKSIVETAVNKEEQVKQKQKTKTWRCCWASSIWAADASTPAEFTVEPRAASDAMDLKVRCLLLLFTFHVQEGYTGNGKADPGSNRLFQVFFPWIRRCFIRLQASHYFFLSIIWIHVFSQLLLDFDILFISSLNSLITECSGCHLLLFGSLGCLFMLNLQDMW